MTKSPDTVTQSRQYELSSLVAKEVQRVLVRFGEVMEEHGRCPPCVADCRIAPDREQSPASRQAIQDDLVALASGFVDRLAAEAARRLDADVGEEALPAALVEATAGNPAARAEDGKGDLPGPLLDGRVPIEMLRQDLAEEVISAARNHGSR
ncbi:hypothetical protein EN766_15230 [Mesorhizobium sp. M2A.F.Ca.ET.046.02.1.1]|nr:hypothetical protein EN766_15230 [Mesorhizobium sp. M2A.F.Ca.ET.046.02.1.1]